MQSVSTSFTFCFNVVEKGCLYVNLCKELAQITLGIMNLDEMLHKQRNFITSNKE